MPAKIDRCVKRVSKTIKPKKKGQSKKSAAYAVCSRSTGYVKKKGGGWKKTKKRGK